MADWTTDALDALDRAIEVVREKTVLPARRASAAIVYGVLAGVFVLLAVGLLLISAFRILVVVFEEVWLVDLILGGILVIAGAFCWRLRVPKQDAERN